jgi:hypothetical protein
MDLRDLEIEEQRAASCEGKQRFDTWSGALRHMRRVRLRRSFLRVCTPYRCRFCQGFHIGRSSFCGRK